MTGPKISLLVTGSRQLLKVENKTDCPRLLCFLRFSIILVISEYERYRKHTEKRRIDHWLAGKIELISIAYCRALFAYLANLRIYRLRHLNLHYIKLNV